jgi:GT2 family glycosyltransferase
MDLSIIIVNYKSRIKLGHCLESIAHSDLSGLKYEVIVVDNASGDHLNDLPRLYPFVSLVYSDHNLGMGGGNNLGLANSTGTYVLISNPDIVFKTDSIKKLLTYFKGHPEIGLIGPQLLNPDGSLQYSGVHFPKWYTPILRRTFIGTFFPQQLDHYSMKQIDHQQIQNVDWLFGACFLVRRGELEDQGHLFDEIYFMYFEDVDLCRRSWSKNLSVVYYPLSQVTHDHIRASARQPWYLAVFKDSLARQHLRSAYIYFKKWRHHDRIK